MGLCRPVIIAPSRLAGGWGVWEMDINSPPWVQANFPPPLRQLEGSKGVLSAFPPWEPT